MADIKLTHVPYRGTGPALTDLLGGHVAMYFSSLPSAIGIVRDGKVRALAVTGAKRSAAFPGPADRRGGGPARLRGRAAVWHRGAGRHAACRSSTSSTRRCARRWRRRIPIERMAKDGTEPKPSTPEEYAADIDREETKWSAVVKKSGAKAE